MPDHHSANSADLLVKRHATWGMPDKCGGSLTRFILPTLGRLAVPEITRAYVAKFHHDLRHIPYQAEPLPRSDLEDVCAGRDVTRWTESA
jgi:hypothetical protein